ncbi:TetR/AcrR family transcriptional regulator [Streptomyces sp. NBC_01387]|uniref:TetR/AcrR family transcriptional regulator n=1 Tax=unclassified Streptomyces TaxID=2593676 RepID=UPI002250B3CC|nr:MULTISPECIES: TetR/AcrR family transcriptional regulator [unclassified Streptomyces]MCX4552319.1 TetR/AcrR family transcriptional regulator [Streptomyces sp. NBC_01500]WSC23684.1 TetR/AcrR family transcriptional regulator [Streptomyces sp. NBC_01766]WSV57554.1 TetR/AcrR family transcriptional regulator [Streptomyces sp. NBC_01014]
MKQSGLPLQQRVPTERSQLRRKELIVIGRRLFADTAYDVLSMDDIAQHAGVAKGLIYYYFKSKRGYYFAIVEDSVADLVARAAGGTDLPRADRVHRTIEGYLLYAQHNKAAFRTIVTGGVGFDTQVQALRGAVREELIATIAEGAYGHRNIPPLARLALLGWLNAVEGVALDWLGQPDMVRETVRELLVRMLRNTLDTIGEFVPECPSPPPAE